MLNIYQHISKQDIQFDLYLSESPFISINNEPKRVYYELHCLNPQRFPKDFLGPISLNYQGNKRFFKRASVYMSQLRKRLRIKTLENGQNVKQNKIYNHLTLPEIVHIFFLEISKTGEECQISLLPLIIFCYFFLIKNVFT